MSEHSRTFIWEIDEKFFPGKDFPVAQTGKKCYSIARRQKAVADIAQSVERILGKDEVPSSNLGISSRKSHESLVHGFLLMYIH